VSALRLSPSSIQTYRRCSLQWFFAYVAKVKLKPPGKVTQGRAVHRGIEAGLKEKQWSGAPAARLGHLLRRAGAGRGGLVGIRVGNQWKPYGYRSDCIRSVVGGA
jgi:hypothetical protein